MVDPLNSLFFNDLSSASHSRDRIVVSTSRCGRDNPGSNPGHGKQLCSVAVTALWANFLSIFCQVNVFRTTSINKKLFFGFFFLHLSNDNSCNKYAVNYSAAKEKKTMNVQKKEVSGMEFHSSSKCHHSPLISMT